MSVEKYVHTGQLSGIEYGSLEIGPRLVEKGLIYDTIALDQQRYLNDNERIDTLDERGHLMSRSPGFHLPRQHKLLEERIEDYVRSNIVGFLYFLDEGQASRHS